MKEESGKISDFPPVEWKAYLEKTVYLIESPKFSSCQAFGG